MRYVHVTMINVVGHFGLVIVILFENSSIYLFYIRWVTRTGPNSAFLLPVALTREYSRARTYRGTVTVLWPQNSVPPDHGCLSALEA